MRIKTIEKLKFKLGGRAVPVVRVSEIDYEGRIHTIELVGKIKKRDNSLIRTWDSTGWEIPPGHAPVNLVDEGGLGTPAYVVSEAGRAVNLYTDRTRSANVESIVGRFATADDISDAMDLQKSVRNIMIGALLSAPVWWIVFQVIGAMAK